MMQDHTGHFYYRELYTERIFQLAGWASGAMGRSGNAFVAKRIAEFYTATHPAVVETVRRNLALLDPGRATARVARENFRQFAQTLGDYFAVGGWTAKEAASLCAEYEGLDYLKEAHVGGKGAILVTGHFSFFEYGAILLSALGIPTTALTLSEPSQGLTRWRAEYRGRWGIGTVEIGSDSFSALQVVKELERGRLCAMLVDRPYQGPRVEVEVPGGSIAFSTSPALLAWIAGCPLLPVVVTRFRDGGYRMSAKEPIFLDRSMPRGESLGVATEKVAAALLPEFREHLEQWHHFVPLSGESKNG